MAITAEGTIRSFRDPIGRVVFLDGRVFRFISCPYKDVTLRFINSAFFVRNCEVGIFPVTHVLNEIPEGLLGLSEEYRPECILEHHRIHFPVYPHECSPRMLYNAGQLTLDLASEAISEGWLLKDATPWNVLFSNGRPVFADVLSFEKKAASLIWNAYAQFQRTFVLPLYAYDRHAWSVHATFLDRRDGLDPCTLEPVIKGWRRWAPFEFQTIVFPARLSQRVRAASEIVNQIDENNQLAEFVLQRSFRRLRKQLSYVRPCTTKVSRWTNYENDLQHYSDMDRESKFDFVRVSLLRISPSHVLDIGANTGEYSLLAATQGANVVAADFDVAALDKLFECVTQKKLPITPVVFNVSRPTPAIGWNNEEIESFLARARGQFQLIMALALVHHLLVTERVSLAFIVKLLFEFEAPYLLIEWVDPKDSRFREIALTHGNLYANLSDAIFELELERYFRIHERLQLRCKTRTLYLCERLEQTKTDT